MRQALIQGSIPGPPGGFAPQLWLGLGLGLGLASHLSCGYCCRCLHLGELGLAGGR